MAGALLLADRPEQAARLLRAAHDLRVAAGTTPAPAERGDLARITTATRQALGDAAFDLAFQVVLEDTTAVGTSTEPPR
jgi:hypothetical protein